LVPEKEEKEESVLAYMDKRLLSTPTVALGQLTKETFRMADMTMDNLNTAMNGFIGRDTSVAEAVTKNNELIGKLDKEISDYLVQVSTTGGLLENEKLVNALHHNLGDISRIADLADNVVKYTRREVRDNLVFSEGINEKIMAMHGLLHKQYDLVKAIVLEKRYELMSESDEVEDEIDASRKALIAEHIERLAQGKCRPENNTVFINLVSNLERIGDHLNFIAHSLDNV
jgi:phosphate:Na+ symporter